MKISEIFTSIQGESSYAGLPCTFIRLSGCNLRCAYCDTQYAYSDGTEMPVDEIIDRVRQSGPNLVEITGGEPLLQETELSVLVPALLDEGYHVLIETNGSKSIKGIDKRAVVILDIKTPGSGMSDKMDFSGFDLLKPSDEIKFVLGGRNDYDWAKDIIHGRKLRDRSEILFSPVFGLLDPAELAGWIVDDNLDIRLNLQIHKYIFDPDRRGV